MAKDLEESIDPIHEEAKTVLEPLASTEYAILVAKLKRDNRRAKLLYKRSLGRIERIRLKEKYSGIN